VTFRFEFPLLKKRRQKERPLKKYDEELYVLTRFFFWRHKETCLSKALIPEIHLSNCRPSSCPSKVLTVIKETILQLKTLSPADRFALAVELWDEVVANPESLEVTDEQLAELDRRYALYQSDPTKVIVWEEAKLRLRAGGQ
jgi:putative addiction module component (TIGR02574 family)